MSLTEIPNPSLPLSLLFEAFESMKIDKGVLQCKVFDDKFGVSHNPKEFKVVKPTVEKFKEFLAQIGYKGDFKAKELKKYVIPGIWMILMHMILRGLSGKHDDTDTMRKEQLYVVYRMFTSRTNAFDLPEVLWKTL